MPKQLGALKLKKMGAGTYSYVSGGKTYYVIQNDEWPGWGWRSDTRDFEDVFPSKREATLALEEWLEAKGQSKGLGAFTSNAELDKFRYVFRKKSGGHSLSVYDGTSLIGKLILQTDVCFPAGTRHAEIAAAEIVPEYRGKKLYQEMLLRTRDYAKAELGCKGLLSRGFERSSMASRAWAKLNPRVEERPSGRPNLFLDGLPRKGRIPLATVKRALRALPPGRKACGITLTSLRKGMEIEREHFDVTKLGVKKTAIIAAAHLCESPRYYDALQKMERRLKRKK